jgi:hypothetical protein
VARVGPDPPQVECPDVIDSKFLEYLKLAEGYGSYPYESLEGGNPTVGYGHKLTDAEVEDDVYENGLSKEQAAALLLEDVTIRVGPSRTVYETAHGADAYDKAPVWGKRMLIDKVFQTGEGGLAQSVKMMTAIANKDQATAYREMLTGYTDTNGNWVYDYGRREKFKTYAMVDC